MKCPHEKSLNKCRVLYSLYYNYSSLSSWLICFVSVVTCLLELLLFIRFWFIFYHHGRALIDALYVNKFNIHCSVSKLLSRNWGVFCEGCFYKGEIDYLWKIFLINITTWFYSTRFFYWYKVRLLKNPFCCRIRMFSISKLK